MGWYLFLVVKGKNFSRGWPEFLFPVVNPKLSYFKLAFVWKWPITKNTLEHLEPLARVTEASYLKTCSVTAQTPTLPHP